MNHTCLCLSSRSWSLFTGPQRDGKLSWLRNHNGEQTVCPRPLRDEYRSCQLFKPSRLTEQLDAQEPSYCCEKVFIALPAENAKNEVHNEEGTDDDEADKVYPWPRDTHRVVYL